MSFGNIVFKKLKAYAEVNFDNIDENSYYLCDDGITLLFKCKDDSDLHSVIYNIEGKEIELIR